jgi:hypothetical protein
MRLLLATAALLLATAAPALARDWNAGTETTTSGTLAATLAWDAGVDAGPQNSRLTITRAGAVAFQQAIPRVCGNDCDRFAGDPDEFGFANLDGSAEPELYLDVFNFDRCCETLGIYEADPVTGAYKEFVLDRKASMFVENADHDGTSEIVTRDTRFTGSLESVTPRQVLRYTGGAVRDVTRDFPGVLRADATGALEGTRNLKRNDPLAPGTLGTYVADQYLLGQGARGLRVLDRQLARGVIGDARHTRAYRRTLLARLGRYGYR